MLEELKKIMASLQVVNEMADAGSTQVDDAEEQQRYSNVAWYLRAAEIRVQGAMRELTEEQEGFSHRESKLTNGPKGVR